MAGPAQHAHIYRINYCNRTYIQVPILSTSPKKTPCFYLSMLLSVFERANQKLDEIPGHFQKRQNIQVVIPVFNNWLLRELRSSLGASHLKKKHIPQRLGELSKQCVASKASNFFDGLGRYLRNFPIPIRKENTYSTTSILLKTCFRIFQ